MDPLIDAEPRADFWVEEAELRSQQRLSWKHNGNSRLTHCTWRGQDYVFKAYTPGFRATADPNALGRQIVWRHHLPDGQREYLDKVTAWPRYRVRDNGLLLGVLLPYAGREFFEQTDADSDYSPRRFDRLIRYRAEGHPRPGIPVHMKRRALGHAAEVLLWLHERRVVVNDVRETNILSTRDGTAVYYVDCDTMMGPWGRMSSAAAPPTIAEVVPQASQPTTGTDLTRFAWLAVWLLLDEFALIEVPRARLSGVIPTRDATLLARAAEGRPVPTDEWRRLAVDWASPWIGQASVPRQAAHPTVTPLAATKPMPQHEPPAGPSSGWVPSAYRQRWIAPPPVVVVPASPPPVSPPARPSSLQYLLIAGVAVLVLCGLAGFSLLFQGVQP